MSDCPDCGIPLSDYDHDGKPCGGQFRANWLAASVALIMIVALSLAMGYFAWKLALSVGREADVAHGKML